MTGLVAGLVDRVRGGGFGDPPDRRTVSVAFVTRQGVRHEGRGQGYRNHVVSLRVGAAVGSCAVEPDALPDEVVYDCVGKTVADLLDHDATPIRIAALDAYLMAVRPHDAHATDTVTVPAGDSLAKSLARAGHVVDLLDLAPGGRVLVVGVVNSLLRHLRARGLSYSACDIKGGTTEWGEPIAPDADVTGCDAVLVSGMTLGNGTFEPLVAAAAGRPVVAFAQTGSAVLPCFVGSGLTAVSAEPYPFFWLDGGPTAVHRYRGTP